MSAVIERDQTIGLELVTGDDIDLAATRSLFFAGDCIDPERKQEMSFLADGGEELHNRCLRRTNGFLPRCEITPMEFWGETLPLEHFPDGIRPYKLKDEPIVDQSASNRIGWLAGKPLFFMPLYPGDLIVDALGLTTGEHKGIVEIDVLKAVDWDTGEGKQLQQLFFPADYQKPIELRLIQERIETVADKVLDPDVKSAASDMVRSCEQFRRWAQSRVDRCNSQLDTRVSHNWTYQYTPQIRNLMKQLEIEPRQQSGQQLQASVLQAIANSGVSPDMFAQMQERDANLVSKLGEVLAKALTEALSMAATGGAKGSE